MAMSAAVQHRSDRPTAYRAFRVPRPAPRKTPHGGRLSPMAGAMRRILIVLLLAILLLPAPHTNKPEPFGPGPLPVRARPLPPTAADPGPRHRQRAAYGKSVSVPSNPGGPRPNQNNTKHPNTPNT